MKRSIAGCIAVALFASLAGGARAQDGKADLLWLVDASVSAGRDGGADRAKSFIVASTALMSGTVSRVAVLQYGGWMETLQAGISVFPPAGMPPAGPERDAFLAGMESTLAASLSFEFSGSDPSVPFDLEDGVLKTVETWREAGPARPVVVVMLTGGGVQGVETLLSEGKVRVVARMEYVKGAIKHSGDANRESVNAETLRHFRETTGPAVRAVENMTVLPVFLGSATEDLAEALAPLAGPAGVVEMASAPLGSIFEAFRKTFPDSPKTARALEPFTVGTVSPGPDGRGNSVLPVVQGTRSITLFVSAPSAPAIRCPATGEDGTGTGAVFGSFGGRGTFRLFRFASPEPGTLAAAFQWPADAAGAGADVAAFRALSYRLALAVPRPEGSFYSGDTVPLRIDVTHGDPPSAVTEPAALAELETVVTLKGPEGREVTKKPGFSDLETSSVALPVQLGTGTWDGAVEIRAELRAFEKEDGSFEFVSEPVEVVIEVKPGGSVVRVAFEKASVLANQAIGLEGEITRGRVPAEAVEVTIAGEDGGPEKTVSLYRTEDPKRLSGEIRFFEPGTWRVVPSHGGARTPAVEPGAKSTVEVKERSIAVEVKKGTGFETVDEAALAYFLTLPEGEEQGAYVFVRPDLVPGETARLRFETGQLKGGWTLDILADGEAIPEEGLEVTGDTDRVEIRLVAKPKSGSPDTGETPLGKVNVVLVVPGEGEEGGLLEVSTALAVSADVKTGPRPWYMNPILWALAGAGLLLLLLLVYLVTGPRFDYQNLTLEGEEGVGRPPQFFVDNVYGIKKRKSTGTEELENAVKIRVKRGGRCFISALEKDVEVRVNGRKISGALALNDGNLVEIMRGDQTRTYRYHDRPASPVDLEEDEFVLMEFDEDDDFVIADEENVPEFEQAPQEDAAPEPAETAAAPHGWVGEETGGAEPGALEEVAPEAEEDLDDLVTQKPPSELVTADPLPMPDVSGEDEVRGRPPEEQTSFDDAVTLMGVSSTGEVTHEEEQEPEAPAPPEGDDAGAAFDEAATMLGLTPPPAGQEAPPEEAGADEEEPQADAEEEAPPAVTLSDMETFLGSLDEKEEGDEKKEDEEEEEEE